MLRREVVGQARPVDTMLQVNRFVDQDWLVEVEADAVIADTSAWIPPP